MRVTVVVLGDLGRSPRMLYHALSLADEGVDVDLIGYAGDLPRRVLDHTHITCWFLDAPGDLHGGGAMFFVAGARRVAAQAGRLLHALVYRVPRPDVLLVQVPPALPTLVVALMAARVRRARVVVDWHNLTSSVLALRVGAGHWLVRLMERYERLMAPRANAHLCVSSAMANVLATERGIHGARVFRDRPAETFRPLTDPLRGERRRAWLATAGLVECDAYSLVVVPTSWSADDAFDLLPAALDRLATLMAEDAAAHGRSSFAPILVVLTGRGATRAHYKPLLEGLSLSNIHVRCVWFSGDEYPQVLACADVGLSLHRSSSGVDLPMKICDLFGAGVPVCALDYGPCLGELVQHEVNGLLFTTPAQLAEQLFELLRDAPSNRARLERLRSGAAASAAVRWRQGWIQEAWPLLQSLPGHRHTPYVK